jgi:TonB family protein
MSKIKNINLEFSCPENRSTLGKTELGYSCDKCSKEVIDFTNKSNEDLQRIISNSLEPICGVFKRAQLSQKFMKYAAATFIATAASLSANGQDIVVKDSLEQVCNHLEEETEESTVFFGMVTEMQAEPIGGYENFLKAIADAIKYPEGLKKKGKVFIQFSIDSLGRLSDFSIVRGYDALADQAALDAMSNINFPFKPGEQRGIPIKTRLIIPIFFDPKNGK